jgi:hypothetical protein
LVTDFCESPIVELCAERAFGAIGFGAGIGQVVALAIDADDEHGAAVSVTDGLIRFEYRGRPALGRGVSDALSETAVTELVGAAKVFDGKIGVVGGQGGFHGAEVLVAKGKDVSPHRKGV